MKRIFCFFVLIALATGVQADNKKKKQSGGGGAPAVKAPGGGGGGGRAAGLPGMSHGPKPTGSRVGAPRASTRSAPSMSHAPSSGHTAANPQAHKTGAAGGTARSSNPLLRKNGQAGAGQHNSNPLTQGNRQGAAGKANPLARQSAAQRPGLNGRKGNPLANKNNPNFGRNRGPLGQAGRGQANRLGARNWQRASHANYRVGNYRAVFHNYHPSRHDRFWYTSRYDRVVVVGGGYYYWNEGYWYPAWGYDPAISFYAYDGPIYSYDNLPPDQVTMNVQTALQDEGYYTGEVDGLVGPKTRDALGAYQADHNLEITSAVDEPTVEALGLT